MSRQLTAQTQPQVQDTSTPANAVLQRTCACGQHTIAGGECASCHQEQPGLQRKAINQFKPASPPPPAPYANSSFSQVQVHTAGSEIIQPKLTVSRPGDKYEREADRVADTVLQMPESSASNGAMRASSSQPLAIQRLQPKPETDLQRQTDDVAVEEEEEEEKGVANLQAKETPGQSGTVSPGLENRVQSIKGGQPLPPSTRTFFEPRFGHDFSQVRLHTGPEAASTAKSINAHAFTKGQNIYFGTGQFQPETQPGRKLLAHELTHTIQQGNTSPSASLEGAAQSSLSVSHPNDSLEHEAKTVANHVEADQSLSPNAITVGANDAQTTLARLAESDTAPATTPEATPAPASTDTTPPIEVTPPTEPISLAGSETFAPSSAWDSYLESRGEEGATVPVRLGNIARGQIPIRKSNETFRTMGERHQSVALSHTALQPLRDAGIQPVLAVIIRQSTIEGYATIATEQGAAGNPQAVVDWIKNHATEMGWAGLDVSQIPNVTNELSGGALRLQLTGFRFTLGGFMNGTGDFGLVNEAVTFNAQATVRVRNITEAQLELEQNEQGNLTGQVELPVSIANFSGNLLAQYGNGTVNIEGTIGYSAEKFSGEVTLLVTDQATARNVARRRLSPDQIAASANQSAGQGEAESGPRPGPRALAGFGTLNFAFTEWMTGRAEVIVDSEGHITVIGEIAPPAEVELFPQRDYIRDIFTLEIRTLYGVPLVGNAFFFANIGMQAMAKLGPGKIYNIAIRGTYSTDPAVLQNYELEATLNISAFAGLRLRAEGGVGIELLGHDIKVGVGIFALAGVQGYVEATPTIGYRETADPQEGRQGEYFIKGHMEIAAQPFLGLGGDLFVELDSPWWSPAPDKKWTWPLGQLEYPLPGEFGIGADVDYVVGSDELPEIQFGEVDFNKDKFMSDLMNDHVPPKTQGEQERQGEWQEGETTGESAEPTLTDSAGAPAQTPARGRREAGEGEAPAPEVQQRWLQGLRAVGDLAERSQRDPYTETEIDAALAQLKTEHGFNTLRAEQVGEDWGVVAEMNPRKKKTDPPRIEAEEDSAESTRTPAEDEQTQPNTVQQELGEFISSLETRIQTTTDTNIANKLKKILKRARRAGNRLNRRSRSPEQISQDLSTLKRQVDNLSTEVPSTEPERPTGPTQHPPGTRFKNRYLECQNMTKHQIFLDGLETRVMDSQLWMSHIMTLLEELWMESMEEETGRAQGQRRIIAKSRSGQRGISQRGQIHYMMKLRKI